MPRPKKVRRMRFNPDVYYFKPRGVPLRDLKEMILDPDEVEAIKLYDVDDLEQKAAALKMQVSQSTFGRILKSAHKKISLGLIKGWAIRIDQ